jgi:hypothetical protein
MMVKVLNDKIKKQFIVIVNDAESHACRVLWIDEDLYDYELNNIDDFDTLYAEARMVKISGNVCVVNSQVIEVVEDGEA